MYHYFVMAANAIRIVLGNRGGNVESMMTFDILEIERPPQKCTVHVQDAIASCIQIVSTLKMMMQ